jgi:sulfur-carrier protein
LRIRTSGVLLRFVGYRKEREVEGATVREGLNRLAEANPELEKALFDADGNVRRTHHIYLNGERLSGDRLDESAGPNDEVQVMTAVAGG